MLLFLLRERVEVVVEIRLRVGEEEHLYGNYTPSHARVTHKVLNQLTTLLQLTCRNAPLILLQKSLQSQSKEAHLGVCPLGESKLFQYMKQGSKYRISGSYRMGFFSYRIAGEISGYTRISDVHIGI